MTPTGEGPAEAPSGLLWQLRINEARLHSEPTNFFLVATAFLLTGFAVMRQEAALGIQFVPLAVGVGFSLLHFVNINYGERVIEIWETKLKAGEALRARNDMFERTWWLKHPLGSLTRNIGSWALPILFLTMWVALIVLEAAHL